MNSFVVETFFNSMAVALLLITVLMFLLFRSIKMAMLSMLPNIAPLIFGTALMVFLHKSIDIGSALVCSVCLGIAVDDTIHFLFNYNKYRKEGFNTAESITRVFRYTGQALVVTTLILMVGFGIFIFADFVPNVNFGILCSLILFMALIFDLIYLPCLLLLGERVKMILFPKVLESHL